MQMKGTPLGRLSERYKAAMEAGGAEKDIANAKNCFLPVPL